MAVFGETLRQARAYKGVTLKEAEQATRINRHHLAALEDENFAALPPLIYQRGIVRNYAAFLDLDPNKVLTMFEDAHGSASATSTIPMAVKPLEMPNHFTPNFAIIAFLVVLSAIVFAWVYSVYRGPSEVLPTPTMQTTVTPIATVDSAAPVSATSTPTPSGSDNAAALAGSPDASQLAATTAAEESSRPMSEANARRTQVARDGNVATVTDSATKQPTAEATEAVTNVAGSTARPTATATAEPENTPTPDLAATDEAVAAEQQQADEAAAAAQAADETQQAVSASMVTVSFSPTADISLTVTGDGVVIFDGFVAAGETVGPFDATHFDVYTSDAASTYVTNLDSGQTFLMSSNSFTLD
jgi:cytoskeletal protein RodZ